jgi:hypothetical protein
MKHLILILTILAISGTCYAKENDLIIIPLTKQLAAQKTKSINKLESQSSQQDNLKKENEILKKVESELLNKINETKKIKTEITEKSKKIEEKLNKILASN